MKINVKILGCRSPQRYAVLRTVIAAYEQLKVCIPDLQMDISEVRQSTEIEKYTPVVIYPSLIINDQLVCVGRFPHKAEVDAWLRQVLS